MLSNIVSNIESGDMNIQLATERTVEKVLLIVITSDRGLAGAYNANIVKAATPGYRNKISCSICQKAM